MPTPRCEFFGYVKVELVARSPRRWAWQVRREVGDGLLVRSDDRFAYAEDALKAGQQVLAALERGASLDQLRASAKAA